MSAIFFDLETSQKDFIGQILNFAFVQIDDQWQEISKFCGEIQISPLELPHPGAILANRIDVIDHQKRAKLSEAPAMREIAQYLTEAAASSKKPIPLIGYNSTRFDIPFLRTSMIRNGVNPYIRNIENKDLLHLVRYLSVSNPHFPRECAGDDSRLSLRLETITHAFKLLAGAQTHNSLDDVYLTIKLAQYLAEKFHGDIRHFHAYQAPTGLKKFDAVMTLHPNYDLNAESNFRALPYVFLDEDRGGSLWVDVEAIASESEWPTRWISKKGGEFITDEESEPSINPAILQKIKTSYKRTSLKNYFSPSVCDIEQDIYRLDFDGRDELTRALWHEDHVLPKDIRSKDARILYLRYLLREQWDDAKSWNLFEKYAHYRYGGKILMKKSGSETENENHLSFSELETELLQSLENAENKEDQKLLHSLKAFYEQSPVARAFANS